MAPGLALLVNIALGLLLLAVAGAATLVRFPSRFSAVAALLPLAAGGLLAAYVFGEDTYRRGGISRWDAYRSPGGALGPMFGLSVTLMALSALTLAYAGLSARERLFRGAALAGGSTSLVLLTATIVGFSAN